jgi:hypothetical protein
MITTGSLPKEILGGEAINQHKQMAMKGAGTSGITTMADTAGAQFDHPPSAPMGDKKRAHPGRGGKTKPSTPSDVDHGHKWGV